jgi:heme oxygenase
LEVHEWTARMERLEASSVSVEEVGEAEKGRARAGFRRQTSASSLLCSC